MTKTLLSTALVAALGVVAFAPAAQAANPGTGTINISGKVIADTCTIDVNGSASSTVTLPTVVTGDLASSGATAGNTNFDIKLANCDTNVASAKMAFNGANIDGANGNLNTTGAGQAGNVQVRLLSGANVINASTQGNAPTIAVTNGNGSTTLTAQYYANGAAASAGLVNTSVGFTLTYN